MVRGPGRDVLVVVAAGPGLGLAVARRFAREGAAVGLVSRSPETVARLADEIAVGTADGGQETAVATADVADEDSLRGALRSVREVLGDPTVLVYNGSEYLEGRPTEVAPDAMLHALRVGVTGAVVALQEVAPAMRAAGRGTVILTGSVAADKPSVSAASVGVAKAALRNLARSAHEELLADGVHATTVTIKGVLSGPKALDLEAIADAYWVLHTAIPEAWQPEVSFPR